MPYVCIILLRNCVAIQNQDCRSNHSFAHGGSIVLFNWETFESSSDPSSSPSGPCGNGHDTLFFIAIGLLSHLPNTFAAKPEKVHPSHRALSNHHAEPALHRILYGGEYVCEELLIFCSSRSTIFSNVCYRTNVISH